MECVRSELDIFAIPVIQSSILRSEEIAYSPLSSIDNSPSTIEFISYGNGDTYRDLSSMYILIKGHYVQADGSNFDNTDTTKPENSADKQPCLINNGIHSLFKQVSISLNGTPVSQCDTNYGYRSYIENLVNFGKSSGLTYLTCGVWNLDNGDLDDIKSDGHSKRQEMMKNSRTIEMMGKIHGDIMSQPILLINNVDFKINFALSKKEFYTMGTNDNFLFKIDQATLFLRHHHINPKILIAHSRVLEQSNCRYYFDRVSVKTFTIPANLSTISIDNAVNGILPTSLIFTMVDSENYNGNFKKNPFNFQHFSISQFHLVINGQSVPNYPLEMNFEQSQFTRAYHTLFSGTGIYHNCGHQITKDMFKNGYFMLAFNLSPSSGLLHSNCTELNNQGSIRIEAKFSKPLPKTITCIVYTQYGSSCIELDKYRNVLTSF